MTSGPEQQLSQQPDRPGVGETLSAAAALLRDHPRETMLPLLAVQAPLVIGTILVTILLYSSVFANEVYPRGGITGVTEGGGQALVFGLVLAVALVFGSVGVGATVVSIGAIAQGRSLGLSEAFDPAFSRLGGLLGVTGILLLGSVALAALAGTGVLILAIAALAALLYFATRLGITYQVFVLEEVGPVQAVGESWRRMQGNMLPLLGILLVILAVVALIGLLVPASPGPGSLAREWRMAIDALLRILQGGIVIPVAAFAHAAITLYYLRIRA